jgi:hypothetical protein
MQSVAPAEMTEVQRDHEIAPLFARGILRWHQSKNRLAFSQQSPLTGDRSKSDSNSNETGRQSVSRPS